MCRRDELHFLPCILTHCPALLIVEWVNLTVEVLWMLFWKSRIPYILFWAVLLTTTTIYIRGRQFRVFKSLKQSSYWGYPLYWSAVERIITLAVAFSLKASCLPLSCYKGRSDGAIAVKAPPHPILCVSYWCNAILCRIELSFSPLFFCFSHLLTDVVLQSPPFPLPNACREILCSWRTRPSPAAWTKV